MYRFKLIEYLLQLGGELTQKPLTDTVQPRRYRFTEILTVEDLASIARALSVLDQLTLSDLVNLFRGMSIRGDDTISVSDLVKAIFSTSGRDIISVAETVLSLLVSRLHETVTVSDGLLHRVWSGNLEGFYPLVQDGQPSGVDLSGKGRNGTVYGSPTVATIDGKQSLYFDGVDDYIDCGSACRSIIHKDQNWSVTFWIYLTSSKTARKVLQIADTNNNRHAVGVDQNFRVFYSLYDGSAWLVWQSTQQLVTNRWHHVAVVKRQGQSPTFYINAMSSQQSTTYSATPHYGYPFTTLRLGQYSIYYSDWFEGYLSDVRIFSNAIDSMTLYQTILDGVTVGDLVRLALQQFLSDGISLSDGVKLGLRRGVVDGISLSDTVTYSLQTVGGETGGIIVPSSYVVYNQNYQVISADLSVMWDNDTSTYFNIYYTPTTTANPRQISLSYNQTFDPMLYHIRVYVVSKVAGKTLYIDTTQFGEWMESFVVTQVGQWVDLYPSEFFNGLNLYPDTSVMGYIGIAEVHIVPNI